jgi:adenylyltransferase/sulfurtransferase
MIEELEVTVKELKRQIDSGVKVQLIDVREPYEFDFCHIEGSRLMPLSQIRNRINELNAEDEYVFYCHVGERSGWVVSYLRELGFKKVRNLRGGIDQWAVEIDRSIPRY